MAALRVVFQGLGAAASCGPEPANKAASVADADPLFRSELERLIKRVGELNIPLKLNGVGRTVDWQCYAICKGWSKISASDPMQGAHLHGFGADLGFDRAKNPFLPSSGDGTDEATHTIWVNGPAMDTWLKFAALLKSEFPKLKWGGDWKEARATKAGVAVDKILLGWDPWHVELKGYLKHIGPGTMKCEDGRAVPASAAEVAVTTVARHPVRSWGLAAAAGLGALWWLTRRSRRR